MSTRVTQVQFQVEGAGQFPFDMLRYDSCYPATQGDAFALEPHRRERRKVTLLANVTVQEIFSVPDHERWQSFMWKVVDGSRQQVG